jgi:hypothetical protein
MRSSIARAGATVATVAASALLVAAPAMAAPDQKATLTTAKPTFAWDGGPGFGVFGTSDVTSRLGCDAPGYDCDFIELDLAQPGDLQVDLTWDAPNTQDLDLHIYTAGDDGAPQDMMAESVKFNPQDGAGESAVASGLDAGKYVAVVDYYMAVAGTYSGKATFLPPTDGAAASARKASAKKKHRSSKSRRRAARR